MVTDLKLIKGGENHTLMLPNQLWEPVTIVI